MTKYMIAVVVILALVYAGGMFSHELAHAFIYENIGEGVEKISFMYTLGYCGIEDQERFCQLAHSVNDTLAYALTPIYILLALFTIVILMKIEERDKKEDEKVSSLNDDRIIEKLPSKKFKIFRIIFLVSIILFLIGSSIFIIKELNLLRWIS